MPLTVAEVSADALGSAFVDHFGTDHPALAAVRRPTTRTRRRGPPPQ
ncbi:hypothetical protein [Embleya sp. NPDC059259]